MKTIIKRMVCIAYLFISLFVLGMACLYPFALQYKDAPPVWTCWILYPLTLLIMASMGECIKQYEKVMI